MKERPVCDVCSEELKTKFEWRVRYCYAARATIFSQRMCIGCAQEMFAVDPQEAFFAELLTEFKIRHKLSWCHVWNLDTRKKFISLLKRNKVPLWNYQVPLYSISFKKGPSKPQYLHDIMTREQIEEVLNG